MQVIRWLAECGNGVVEGYEECDTGSRQVEGCSRECTLEPGFDCTMISPSVCTRLAPGEKPVPRVRCKNHLTFSSFGLEIRIHES